MSSPENVVNGSIQPPVMNEDSPLVPQTPTNEIDTSCTLQDAIQTGLCFFSGTLFGASVGAAAAVLSSSEIMKGVYFGGALGCLGVAPLPPFKKCYNIEKAKEEAKALESSPSSNPSPR